MNPAPDRPAYRPSGRCDAARLPAALAVLAATAAGITALYCGQIFGGVYISALSVFWPTLLVAGGARAAVKRGHWRNRAVAGALAGACGLLGYLGYFHADQCLRWGVPVTAVERLPGYVAFRMETDQWVKFDRAAALRPLPPAAGIRPERPLAKANFRSWNWAGFAFEVLLLALVPLATAVVSAGEPYSEKSGCWCSRELLTLAPDTVAALRRALAEGTVGAWAESGPRKVGAHQPHGKVVVWYTRAEDGAEPDADVYVTVGGGRPLRLEPEEAAALVTLLPGVLDLEGASLRQLAAEAEQADDPASARVCPVPAPYAGQAQNPRTRRQGRLLVWKLTLLPAPVVVLLLPGGVWFLSEFVVGKNLLPMWSLVVYVLVVGFSCVAWLRWWYRPGHMMPLVKAVRFDHDLLRRAVASRPRPLVAADDPRAVFAEMSPRRFWSGTTRPECGEYNQGLLLVDAARRGILFEGDYDRYWIPAAAIQACDVEALPGAQATTASFWAVVLRVRLGGGTWEFPFFPLANIEGGNRWERAQNLLRRIEAVCGRDFADQPTAPPRDPGHTPVV
jgi:hypothetical protein